MNKNEVPDYLREFMDDPPAEERAPATNSAPIAASSKNVEHARAYVSKMPPAISGQNGHGQTLEVARVLVHDFALNESDAWNILNEYNGRCIPTWGEKELQHKLDEALKLSNEGQCKTQKGCKLNGQRLGPAHARTAPVSDAENFPLTDLGNAQRLIARHGPDLRYCPAWSKWLVYEGKRWKHDEKNEVVQFATKTIRAMLRDAAIEPDDGKRRELLDFQKKSEHVNRVSGMVRLAQSEADIPITPDVLDRDLWLFSVQNGTINLNTGELLPHRREDLITRVSPVAFDASADCLKFRAFISRITQDSTGTPRPELITFIQKACGYALTGDVREQCLFILHGEGANGKTTLLNILLHVLGEYSAQADPELLMAKDGNEHPTGQADLFRRRLAVCTETNEGKRFDEARLKRLTGEDKIKARFMRCDFFEFQPTHKLFLACNHKPSVRGTDHAFWRRIRLIPFDVTISDAEKDKNLLAKLKAEASGILNWMLEGCRRWQAEGLTAPSEVNAATQNYRHESDSFAQFIEAECVLDAQKWTASAELREKYEEFCKGTGCRPNSNAAFTKNLKKIEAKAEKDGGKRGWRGIGFS